ncbi:hypothetical protein CEXT_757991 [Caerostris extrusa]|uniref:Uncharacterized protein n=1 Tax=Caerostris extrusa TaxID=172846 RepID=A0AAV4U7K0_CAEEX|nr:hypothetical protein CEXT_757991 [Caerostris extrusa]
MVSILHWRGWGDFKSLSLITFSHPRASIPWESKLSSRRSTPRSSPLLQGHNRTGRGAWLQGGRCSPRANPVSTGIASLWERILFNCDSTSHRFCELQQQIIFTNKELYPLK